MSFRYTFMWIFSIFFFCVILAYYLNAVTAKVPSAAYTYVEKASPAIKVITPSANQSSPSQNVQNVNKTSQPPDIPTIFVITPTYTRLEQKAELTRLSQTLKLVKSLFWIVVEDSENKTALVENHLKNSGLSYAHVASSTDRASKKIGKKLSHRGVEQRNEGLKWLRTHPFPAAHRGVVYFADDDNTYDIRVFEEMRYTKKVSVWPVGLSGQLRYESPIVKDNKVVGWLGWTPSRRFALDMAGFAVNLQLIKDIPSSEFTHSTMPGGLETKFLSSLKVGLDDLEPRADQCTKVLVWHTKTRSTSVADPRPRKNVFIKGGVKDKDKLMAKYLAIKNFEV